LWFLLSEPPGDVSTELLAEQVPVVYVVTVPLLASESLHRVGKRRLNKKQNI
jgi:hypothetical protein